jgi:DNA-directed RNA polymerase specialized sigma24 family protein
MAVMREEFVKFCDREHESLVRFLMNVGASLQDAQDAAQEAFIDGWRLAESGVWTEVRNPAGWIRKVGQRKYYRHRGRAGREVPVPDFADAPPPCPWPADLADEARAVLDGLRRLPPREQTALALQIDGFSCRETADYLGITEQQAADLRKKARKAFTGEPDEIQIRRRAR